MSNPFDASEAPPTTLREEWGPYAVFFAMVAGMLVFRLFAELGVGILLFAAAMADGMSFEQIAQDPTSLMRSDLLAVGTVFQLGGMVAVLAGVLALAGWPQRKSFGIVTTRSAQYAAAIAGGGLVGFVASSFSEFIRTIVPEFLQNQSLQGEVVRALTEGPLLGRMLMVVAVTLAAPLFEELAFRGALWEAIERMARRSLGDARPTLPRLVAFVLTTFAFAAYHLDPVHVIALLPTAAFLGWLRFTSRSVWPGIVAHFVNNTLATALVHFETDPSQGLGLPFVLGALVLTLIVAYAAHRLSEPVPT